MSTVSLPPCDRQTLWWLCHPVVVVITGIIGWPLVRGIFLSLTNANEANVERQIGVNKMEATYEFVGLENYADILTDSKFWDRLGWTDTFAHPAFTSRQWAYARHFKRDQVYTPQVVVNGRVHGVGARRAEIERMIQNHPRGSGPALTMAADAVTVGDLHLPGIVGIT